MLNMRQLNNIFMFIRGMMMDEPLDGDEVEQIKDFLDYMNRNISQKEYNDIRRGKE